MENNYRIEETKNNDNIKNLGRSSFSVWKTQLKLKSLSKLININYEKNKQPISKKNMIAIIEEKSNKSYCVDEEELKEKDKENKNEK